MLMTSRRFQIFRAKTINDLFSLFGYIWYIKKRKRRNLFQLEVKLDNMCTGSRENQEKKRKACFRFCCCALTQKQ